jgi:hypothetical protein
MPLGKDVKYRVAKSGVRLAFKGGKVIEAKNLDSGKVHTPAEFKADAKKTKREHGFMNAMMRRAT